MPKTMQQIDHDAWEEGYGVNSTADNLHHNSVELEAMYKALARREAAKKAAAKKAEAEDTEATESES